jgi:butyryl-CoA dehydrogenase
MNFDLSDYQKGIQNDLADVIREEAGRFAALKDEDPKPLQQSLRKVLQKLEGRSVYLHLGLDPREVGDTPFAQTLNSTFLGQELARVSPSLFITLETSTRLFGWIIARFGTETNRRDFLLPIQKGQKIGALGLSESNGNFPKNEIETTARREGDFYRISGFKKQVINAPIADFFAVTGRIDGQEAFFLLSADQEGLLVGAPLKTLGFQGLTQSDVRLNQCLIPAEQVIGPLADETLFLPVQIRQNLIYTLASLGIMERAVTAAKHYSGESREGGKPPQAYQEIRFKLAEMFTLLQTSQWLLYRAAWMLEAGMSEAETVAAAAKVFVTESAEEVTREALQIMGLEGYRSGHDLEECFRDARLGPVAGETSEVLRMRIADDCLARY